MKRKTFVHCCVPNIFPSRVQLGLDKQYIGDGYPLCNDLPTKHFLKAGATYRLLAGTSGEPDLISEQTSSGDAAKKRVVLESDSELGGKMCQVENESPCLAYKSKVVLSSDITTCKGIECLIEVRDKKIEILEQSEKGEIEGDTKEKEEFLVLSYPYYFTGTEYHIQIPLR